CECEGESAVHSHSHSHSHYSYPDPTPTDGVSSRRLEVHMKRALFGFAAVALLATPAAGQTVQLDEGTFRILVGGREVGTETFSLRQNGTGEDAVVIAQGRVVLDSNETTANVQLSGSGLRLVAYDVEISGDAAQRIRASVSRGRASS